MKNGAAVKRTDKSAKCGLMMCDGQLRLGRVLRPRRWCDHRLLRVPYAHRRRVVTRSQEPAVRHIRVAEVRRPEPHIGSGSPSVRIAHRRPGQ